VSAVHASREARSKALDHAATTSTKAAESTINNTTTTNLSDVTAMVAEVLNSLINTIDGNSAAVTEDTSMKEEGSAEGCSFAIDTAPTVELVPVKSEHVPVDEPAHKEDGLSVETPTTRVEVCESSLSFSMKLQRLEIVCVQYFLYRLLLARVMPMP